MRAASAPAESLLARCLPAGARSALDAGLADALGSAVERIDVTDVRERPYSTICFCSVHLRDGRALGVVVKFYKVWLNSDIAAQRQLLARDYEITTYLHRLLAGQSRFRVPTPLFHSPQELLIATENMAGTQLQAKLKARAGWLPSEATVQELERDCRACGEWLREFQRLTRSRASGEADVVQMRKMIADRLEWSVDASHMPIDAAQRQVILEHFDRIARRLDAADLAASGMHADFFAGNVLVAPSHVVGLDFVMYREGSVYADATYFIYQLETLRHKLQFRGPVVTRLRNAFLAGYEPALEWNAFASRPMVQLCLMFHQAMRLGRMLQLKDAPVLRRLNNRRIALATVSRLCALAAQGTNVR